MIDQEQFQKLLELSRLSKEQSADLNQDFREIIGYIEQVLVLYEMTQPAPPVSGSGVGSGPKTSKMDLLTDLSRVDEIREGEANKTALPPEALEKIAALKKNKMGEKGHHDSHGEGNGDGNGDGNGSVTRQQGSERWRAGHFIVPGVISSE